LTEEVNMDDFSNLVEGGVLPPRLVLHSGADNKTLMTVDIPDKGYIPISERFEPVIDRYVTLNGEVKVRHKGYRYRCEIKLRYLNKETLRQIKCLYNRLTEDTHLIIQPHRDRPDISYQVDIEEPFLFEYIKGRMVGYYGTLKLTGVKVLTAIPTDYKVFHFCSISGEYSDYEITYFTSTTEENYNEGEISHFCPSDLEKHSLL